MEIQDASREPEMVSHYVSQAIAQSSLSLDNRDVSLIQKLDELKQIRKKLISKLELLDKNTGSKDYYELSLKCLEYINKNNEWKTLEDIKLFSKEYNRLRENLRS